MTSADLIPAAVLKRKAVVYVRQSTQSQVMTNLESQRRQYDLVEVARQWGFSVPFGYIWHREVGLGLDPDLRLQEVIRLIFARFRELGSARQVLLSMKAEQVHFPRPSDGRTLTHFDWIPVR